MRHIEWDAKINLGHVIQVVTFLILAGSVWVNLDRRITRLEMANGYVEVTLRELNDNQKILTDNQTKLTLMLATGKPLK